MTDTRGAGKEMMLYYKEMMGKKKEKKRSNRETQQILTGHGIAPRALL